MKYFKLNSSNSSLNEFPYLGFGAMSITEFYGKTNEIEALKSIQKAIELGINHFDTADDYGCGDNESFLKRALNLTTPATRKNLILASKAGIQRDAYSQILKGINITPSYLMTQLDKSLNNLGTDYLDIFYIHRLPPNSSLLDLEKLANFLNELKQKNIVRAVGLSEPKLEQLLFIHNICPISFIQSEFSILEKGVETKGDLAEYRKIGIHFIAYSPLSRGLLTDTFNPSQLTEDDFRSVLPRFNGTDYLSNQKLIIELKNIALRKGITLSCLSLAYLIHKGVTALPGLRKTANVIDAFNAIEVNLSPSDIHLIDELFNPAQVKGSRYPQKIMKVFDFE